jgi:hypothetical protein
MDKDKKDYKEKPLIRLTEDLWDVLEKMKDNAIAFSIADLDRNPLAVNTMRVEEIDISKKEYRINCKIAGKFVPIKLSAFIRNFFGDSQFDQEEVDEFIEVYNSSISGKGSTKPQGRKVESKPFRFNPTNVKETFLSLVQETYPHGHEEEVVPFITPGLKKDDYGNYYTIIGDSDTVFTCHLDTASRSKNEIGLIEYTKSSEDYIMTDGKSILGADDKAGVTVLMYMIANNVPGVYWFFIGEERGGLGSRYVSNHIENYDFMKGKTKCVSFDRRNYFSVITQQMGVQCCSNEFGKELCDALSTNGLAFKLDPTGIFTDSASFIDQIPECTNISVGYFNEHTVQEFQNMTHLENLCKAAVSCDWKSLGVHRKLDSNIDEFGKHKKVGQELTRTMFYNHDRMSVENEVLSFEFEITDAEYEHLDSDLYKMVNIMKRNGVNISPETKVKLSQNKIKIEVK